MHKLILTSFTHGLAKLGEKIAFYKTSLLGRFLLNKKTLFLYQNEPAF